MSSGGSIVPSGNHCSGVGTEHPDTIPLIDTPTTAPTASAHNIAHVAGNIQYRHDRSDTVGTTTSNVSESIYSTETADAAVELGYVTFGSTPVLSPTPPPLPSLPPLPPLPSPPPPLPPLPHQRTLQMVSDGLLPLGAAKSSMMMVPGLLYDNQSTFSSFYSQSSAAVSTTPPTMTTTRTGGSLYSQESAPQSRNAVGEFGQTSS